MIDVISVENMRESDASTIAAGTDSKELMRRAGYALSLSYDYSGKKILIAVGKGNNGGDGFALASVLKDHGIDSEICCSNEGITPDSAFFREQCINKKIRIFPYEKNSDFSSYDVIVDCLLGTGFRGEPKEPFASFIQDINDAHAFVISADINSGVNGNTGEYIKAIRSDLTVTIGYLKTGLLFLHSDMIGRIHIADIGIKLIRQEDKAAERMEYDEIPSLSFYDSVHSLTYKEKEGNKVYLLPENMDYKPIIVK